MKFWPFKKKKLVPIGKTAPFTITLDSKDDAKTRAMKMCQVAGIVINQNMYDRLDDIAQVFEFYQKHDYLSGKKAKIKNQ
jgi:hypothetical protein